MSKVLDIDTSANNRSHFKDSFSIENAIETLKEKIICRGDLPHISVKDQLELLRQLSDFPFGRYLLERKGANGFWTDYLIFNSDRKLSNTENNYSDIANVVEDFIFNRSLIVLAHRERIRIFQNLIQQKLNEDIVLASIPCGVMRDLITLDFSKLSKFRLVGLDIDQESLDLAQKLAQEKGILNIDLLQKDAWQMSAKDEFDIISSSGLNVYEPNSEKILDLYKRFFTALKPGGFLIISVLTYPPGELKKTDWILDNISHADLLMENILYKDILGLHWRNFRSSDELEEEFKQVGFTNISVHFDKNHIFPTIMAHKI